MNIKHWMGTGVAGFAGAALVAGLGLLAGCPSHSNEQASAPPPVARAASFGGVVYGGRQPIECSGVTAWAVSLGTSAAPIEIGSAETGGATCPNGSPPGHFGMTFSPTPATGQVVYVVARGGDATGTNYDNPAIGLMTVAGIQGDPFAPVPGTVNINELTTVASTAALKHFLTFSPCPPASGLAGDCVSLARLPRGMALSVRNLVNPVTGRAAPFLVNQPAGSALHVTLEKLDTLANILAACVNAARDSNTCPMLFGKVLNNPDDTLRTAWLVASSPVVNAEARALYGLAPTAPIFAPVLAAPPEATTLAGFWTVGGERFVLAANYAGSDISAWRAGSRAGLTPITGDGAASCGVTPDPANCFPAGTNPVSVTVTPTGQFAYVANTTGRTVSGYRIEASGALSSLGPVVTGIYDPASIAVDPTGRFAYVASYGINIQDDVRAYRIEASGALSALGAASTDNNEAVSVAVDPNGRYVYVATNKINDRDGYAYAYRIKASGALSALGAVPAGARPISVAVDSSGRYVYVANQAGNNVSAFKIKAGGALSAIAPAVAGDLPSSVAADPTDPFVYVANSGGYNVSAYRIEASGALSALGPTVAAGADPTSVAVGPTGQFAYVANNGDRGNNGGRTVSVYRIEASGALSALGAVPAGDRSNAVAVDPTGNFAYVANYAGNVSAYRIGHAGGLDPVSGNACSGTGTQNCFPAGTQPYAIALGPAGRYVYTANEYSHNVSGYTVGTKGRLAALSGSPFDGMNDVLRLAVAVVPSGRYLYVSNRAEGKVNSTLSAYTIAPATGSTPGALTVIHGTAACGTDLPSTCYAAGARAAALAITPNEHYLYAANYNGDDISQYAIAPASAAEPGGLQPLAATACNGSGVTVANCIAVGGTPYALAVTPNGQYLYAATGGGLWGYAIGTDGRLSDAAPLGQLGPTGMVALGMASGMPGGPFLYAVGTSNQQVSAYSINVDGTLNLIGTASTGANPHAIAVMGATVYVANASGNTVSVYTIADDSDPTVQAGTLIPVPGAPCGGGSSATNCVPAGNLPQSIAAGP